MTGDDVASERGPSGYRRSARTPRGEDRRRELLAAVTDDLAVNGLVGFSLRRAAKAAGSTHKVLLYHFESADDLLLQAVVQLRERRIADSVTAIPAGHSLSAKVRTIWPILSGVEASVLEQAIGLSIYDPDRHAALGRTAAEQYLPTLMQLCPENWPAQRQQEVAELILAALRGFLVDARTRGDAAGIESGFAALTRVLDREEAADH